MNAPAGDRNRHAPRVLLVGIGAMGDTHSQAWRSVGSVFGERPVELVGVVGRDESRTADFARRWGWQASGTDLAAMIRDTGADVVDVCSPNHLHRPHVEQALAAGSHVVCEKPLAATLADAAAMAAAAAASDRHSFVWFNYRRTPAVSLARQLVADGRIGTIRQVRAAYLQTWGLTAGHSWRFDAGLAGSGAHGDIASHLVDTVGFVTGQTVTAILGAVQERVVDERRDRAGGPPVPSDVDDISIFTARLSAGGLATFEASRVASGYLCANRVEIHGDAGALRFDFEDMNRLGFFDGDDAGRTQGWRSIHVTRGQHGHPYVDHWWPEGHGIGYEHTFVHQAADVLAVLDGREPLVPLPTFADALTNAEVLHAASVAAARDRPVPVAEAALPA